MRYPNGRNILLLLCGLASILSAGCLGSTSRGAAAPTSAPTGQASRSIDWQGPVEIGGRERNYLLHLPDSYDSSRPAPLVLVFHGGRGSARQIARYSGFNRLADEKGFLVVYPDGLDGHWNDGRPRTAGEGPPPDDVAFVSVLIDRLSTMFSIDRRRVYAAGMSNGGIFVQRLGCQLPDRIAAVATVAGTFAEDLAGQCKPSRPLSVLMIHGTADEFVPYNGGQVRGDISGRVLSVEATAALWLAADGLADKTPRETVLDAGSADATRVRCQSWLGGKAGTAVVVYTVEGGGHTWPGAPLGRLGSRVLGPTSRDFSATRAIWEFFELHPKLR